MSDWYYAANDEQKGPINESELKANLAANKIPADSLVWKDGMADWTPANQVPAFSFRPPPSPAKVQPPAASAAPAAAAPATKVVAANPTVNNPDSTKPVDLKSLIGTPEALEVDVEDADKNKVMGILAYVIFLVPLIVAKDSPFAKYHTNQGLALVYYPSRFLARPHHFEPHPGGWVRFWVAFPPRVPWPSRVGGARHHQRRRRQMRSAARHRRGQAPEISSRPW